MWPWKYDNIRIRLDPNSEVPNVSLPLWDANCNNYYTVCQVGSLKPNTRNLIDLLFSRRSIINDIEIQQDEIWTSVINSTWRILSTKFILLESGVSSQSNASYFNFELFKTCMGDIFLFSTDLDWKDLWLLFKETITVFGTSRIDKLSCHDHRPRLIVIYGGSFREYDTKSKVNEIWKECTQNLEISKFFDVSYQWVGTSYYMTNIQKLRKEQIDFISKNRCNHKILLKYWLPNAEACWEYITNKKNIDPPPYESSGQGSYIVDRSKLYSKFVHPILAPRITRKARGQSYIKQKKA